MLFTKEEYKQRLTKVKKIYVAGNFINAIFLFCMGFLCFWPAKLFLASQNLILASQKIFGRADGIGISPKSFF